MDVGDEHLIRVIQRAQEARLLAVTGIDTDRFEPHAQTRAWRTMSTACRLFEVSLRAVFGTPASSHRAGSSIQTFGR